jgi:pSer/pThr/pTyr-binding forkhead associated (FHA) protein
VAKTGPFAGRVIPVTRADFWLGAAPNNDLTIPDETVSGNHAWLHFEADTLKIFDNHSTNNTWVNGQPVGETARLLFPGDEIRIGRSVLVVERANVAQSANGSALP